MPGKLSSIAIAFTFISIGYLAHDLVPRPLEASAQEPELTGGNYLYIQEFEMGDRMTPHEYITEAVALTKAIRATNEYKSVRLFSHNTGPHNSVYIFMEPKSWQSIETGAAMWLESFGVLNKPWIWKSHSDNVLSEIPVE